MPTIVYQKDRGQSTTQKTPAKFGNELTGGKESKVYEKGSQAHTSNEPIQTPDIWDSFKPTKGSTI